MKTSTRKFRNGLVAATAGTALLFGSLAPAHADITPQAKQQQPAAASQVAPYTDLAVSANQTGGIQGLFGRGTATVTNTGNTTIPAGVVVDFRVAENHQSFRELHAITLFPQNFGKMITLPITLNQGQLRTIAPLEPGESVSFNWTVLHYGFWHRVAATISIAGMPQGVQDSNPRNNVTVEDNNGRGL